MLLKRLQKIMKHSAPGLHHHPPYRALHGLGPALRPRAGVHTHVTEAREAAFAGEVERPELEAAAAE